MSFVVNLNVFAFLSWGIKKEVRMKKYSLKKKKKKGICIEERMEEKVEKRQKILYENKRMYVNGG